MSRCGLPNSLDQSAEPQARGPRSGLLIWSRLQLQVATLDQRGLRLGYVVQAHSVTYHRYRPFAHALVRFREVI